MSPWGRRFDSQYQRRLWRIVGEFRDCPVCLMPVVPSARLIGSHADSVGFETCPMSGELFELARVSASLAIEKVA